MKIIRVGVDLAKNVYQVHGVDKRENPVWQRQLNRGKWLQSLTPSSQRFLVYVPELRRGYVPRLVIEPRPRVFFLESFWSGILSTV